MRAPLTILSTAFRGPCRARPTRSEFGLPPHRYLTGRRVDTARRLVLEGTPLVEVATAAGFHDQAHLSRHFVRLLGTTPGRFAGRAGRRRA
jgi:transcriptional regulator GlxA family with amidase domain